MSTRRLVLLFVAVIVLTFTIYKPAWRGGLLWDDEAYLTAPALQPVEGLRRIWTEPGATLQYYPVVYSTFWILHRVAGDDTLVYHLVNIGLHALSACLIALILRRLAVPWWWLAALLFAVHPVQVESVAWMTELKNTLSGALYFAAALAYLAFRDGRRRFAYGIALVLFVLALLSKSVTATLPAALLVVAWWQRGRIDWRADVRPLVPFFAMGIAAGVVTTWMEHSIVGAHGAEFQLSFVERCLLAGRAVSFYLAKLAWPRNLTFIYPRWEIDSGVWWQYVFPLSVVAMLVVCWRLRGWSRAPLAALLVFGVTLAPALGFVNVFPFRYSYVADHFQYLACVSMIALACGGLAHVTKRMRVPATAAAMGATMLLVAPFSWLTWSQSHQYADAATLYRETIARNPGCWLAHNNLGFLQLNDSLPEAMEHFRQALALNPGYPEAHNNLGYALQQLGRFEEAVDEHREAIRLEPGFAVAHTSLGTAYGRLGRLVEAAAEYRRAVELRPALPEAHANLGIVLAALGRDQEAMLELRMALALDPTLAVAHKNLADVLMRNGKPDEAAFEYGEASRLQRQAIKK